LSSASTPASTGLVAHEAAHVSQQGAGAPFADMY
jgi:hypothetical protein